MADASELMQQMAAALQAAQARIGTMEGQLQQALHERQAVHVAPRTASMEQFDGKAEKLDGWLFKLERILAHVNSDLERISYAELHLSGTALAWARLLDGSGQRPNTWHDWVAALRRRFNVVNSEERARAQLFKLRQTTDLQDYVRQFDELSLQIAGLDEGTKLYLFINGLRPELRREVQPRQPKSYMEAVNLADGYDQVLQAGTTYGDATARATLPAPMELDATDGGDDNELAYMQPRRRPQPQQRRREAGTMDARGETRRCFTCGRVGHLMRDCPNHERRPWRGAESSKHPNGFAQ